MANVCAFAEPTSQFDAAQERARKDYELAMAKIDAVSKADQAECAKHVGPAAKACTIQADGKRDAAQEEAKLALARARDNQPTSKMEQVKAAAKEKRQAKVAYGVAQARITNNRNLANAQCSKLKNDDEQQCRDDVHARYTEASDSATSRYARALAKAQALLER